MNFPNNLMGWMAVAFIAMLVTVSSGTLYFLLLEEPYLSYENIPFPAELKVEAGEIVPITKYRCNNKTSRQNYITSHSLANIETGEVAVLDDVRITILPGCSEIKSMINKIPLDTKVGTYYLFGTAEVRGTVRTHYVDWHTQPFRVEQ